jgi:hypothetical protein
VADQLFQTLVPWAFLRTKTYQFVPRTYACPHIHPALQSRLNNTQPCLYRLTGSGHSCVHGSGSPANPGEPGEQGGAG